MSRIKPFTPFIIIIAIFVALLVPKLVLTGFDDDSAKASSRQGQFKQPVRTQLVEARTFEEELVLNGSIIAVNSVEIRSEMSGRVVEINFKDGEKVEAGQLLVRINDDELQAQRKQIVSNLQLATIQEERQIRLLEGGSSSVQNYDEARIRKESLNAELELIDAQLEKTQIRAPFDGTLGLRRISVGTYLQPSQLVLDIEQLTTLNVDFAIPERYLPQIEVGLPITLTIAGSNNTFPGEIIALAPSIEAASRTLTARAVVDNSNDHLKPGAYAIVTCTIERKEKSILIPSGAVIPSINKQTVYIYKDGKAIETEVTTGSRTPSETEILSGLKPGDELIVSGIQSLRPNLDVEIAN